MFPHIRNLLGIVPFQIGPAFSPASLRDKLGSPVTSRPLSILMIPRIVHYCFFNVSPDKGGKPWSLVHYACLKSAIENIKPLEVIFYCDEEPTGPWWERTRDL